MEHYAPTHDLSSPWRTRTLIVSSIAVAELLALVGLAVVLLGKGWFQSERAAATKAAIAQHRAAAAASTKPAPAKPKPPGPAKSMLAKRQTSVLVLNGNGRDGAAGAEAGVLRAHGYPVAAVGNAKRSDYAASIVMYRPGYPREAARLARELKIPIVGALDGVLVSQLKGAKAVLIVGK
jgi:LytR cell envelope-related transcriptional attenuator